MLRCCHSAWLITNGILKKAPFCNAKQMGFKKLHYAAGLGVQRVLMKACFIGSFWVLASHWDNNQIPPHWLWSHTAPPAGCWQYRVHRLFNVLTVSVVTCLPPLSVQEEPEACQDSVATVISLRENGNYWLLSLSTAVVVFPALTITSACSCKQSFLDCVKAALQCWAFNYESHGIRTGCLAKNSNDS